MHASLCYFPLHRLGAEEHSDLGCCVEKIVKIVKIVESDGKGLDPWITTWRGVNQEHLFWMAEDEDINHLHVTGIIHWWLCSSKIWLTKQVVGWIQPTGYSLPIFGLREAQSTKYSTSPPERVIWLDISPCVTSLQTNMARFDCYSSWCCPIPGPIPGPWRQKGLGSNSRTSPR